MKKFQKNPLSQLCETEIGSCVHKFTLQAFWNIIANRLEIQIETSTKMYSIHHFKSELINDMDHMRISGTEPSSMILSQTFSIKVEK